MYCNESKNIRTCRHMHIRKAVCEKAKPVLYTTHIYASIILKKHTSSSINLLKTSGSSVRSPSKHMCQEFLLRSAFVKPTSGSILVFFPALYFPLFQRAGVIGYDDAVHIGEVQFRYRRYGFIVALQQEAALVNSV